MLDLGPDRELHEADHLDAAADYIERHGWTQRHMVAGDGSVCAIGALGMTERLHGEFNSARSAFALAATIRDLFPTILNCHCNRAGCAIGIVEDWNDEINTTKDDVVAAMQKTANELREKVR